MGENLDTIFAYIDENRDAFVRTLSEAVSIKSVSACPQLRPEVIRMVHWIGDKLESFGAQVEYCDVGMQDENLRYPPVIMARLDAQNEPSSKKTVLIYGHLDVQPAAMEDGWDTDPFVLSEKDGKLYGRGSSDDKGPVLGWIHAIEAHRRSGLDLPVNLRFVLEGMEESDSEGLDDLLESRITDLQTVDYVCVSDNYWLGTDKPCLTYGLRGIVYFQVEISCCNKDLHSGVFGGTVHESMSDLVAMLDSLVLKDRILIDGIYNDVAPLTLEEELRYKKIQFDVEAFKADIGVKTLLIPGDDSIKTLMARWRYPSLSLHGIQGAFSDPGAKTVIPRTVIGKFSIRTVPNQTSETVIKLVENYLNRKWKERNSPNSMKITSEAGECWSTDPNHPNFLAGRKATELVYGVEPELTREGGSIPVVLTLEKVTGKNVLLLPMGAGDDGAHSQNEKIDVRNYIQGTKLFAAYLHELSKF